MFLKSSQRDAVFDVKVVVFLWVAGWDCVNPACLKQLETVNDVSQFQAWINKWRASSTLMFGISPLSIDFMNFRRTRFLWCTLRFYILPWFIGCVFEVVFGSRNTCSTALRPAMYGWAGQLSIISANFLFIQSIFFHSFFTHSVKISEVTHAFLSE